MSKLTLTIPSHVELTVRRPNGDTEVIRHPSLTSINDKVFAQIAASTKAAGRGEVLSYSNVTKQVEESDEMYAQRLAGEAADRATASTRNIERMMARGE